MISVIMPVYKVEKYLDRAITSVLNQKHTDFELLLIDDGSPDNCGAICDEWAKKDSRIKVFHKPNGGVSSARNLGIENAQGKYIAFMDSDDFAKPEWLSDMYTVAVNTGADLVKSGLMRFTEKTDVAATTAPLGFDVDFTSTIRFETRQATPHQFHQLLVDNFYYTANWNQLIKAEISKKCMFSVGKTNEDYLALFSILEHVKNIQITDSTCYCYGTRPDGITGTLSDSFIADMAENLALHSSIFISKYNDTEYAAKTLHQSMVWFFYHLISSKNICNIDRQRVSAVWKVLKNSAALNNVRQVVPRSLYIQYSLCRISLPLYLNLVKLKKAVFK